MAPWARAPAAQVGCLGISFLTDGPLETPGRTSPGAPPPKPILSLSFSARPALHLHFIPVFLPQTPNPSPCSLYIHTPCSRQIYLLETPNPMTFLLEALLLLSNALNIESILLTLAPRSLTGQVVGIPLHGLLAHSPPTSLTASCSASGTQPGPLALTGWAPSCHPCLSLTDTSSRSFSRLAAT